MLSKENKRLLLGLARRSIEYYLDNRQKFEPDLGDIPYELCEDQGVFVTLNKKSGELRGCVGYIEPVKAIWMLLLRIVLMLHFMIQDLDL
jgi:AMMECR1 domain-containing protein